MQKDLYSIEQLRLQEQIRLDSLKTAKERNKWGQFATPSALAVSIASHTRTLIGKDVALRFLDPAVGTGSFFSALAQLLPSKEITAATGIELDPLFAKMARSLWAGHGLDIVDGDFTRLSPPSLGFNLILSNPPYVRHHHISAEEKDRLKEQLARSLHLPISGLAGLYCYFLLLAHDWMENGGIAAWLIPSEFMDVNYGVTVRRYLTDRVTLLHLHRFSPADEQFADALVTSAVVIFRKSPPPLGHTARFSFGGPIGQPLSEALISLDALKHAHKWTQFPGCVAVSHSDELTLGDIFSIKRGLATGSNNFFILTEQQVNEWKVPSAFAKPILPGPRHLARDIVDALPNGAPDVLPRLSLIDCNESEERIEAQWPRFHEYLEKGKAGKINASYLTRRRSPWYSQEQRPPAPFLCTYMGRSRNGKQPFRFIWNRSQATAHNVYLMLYPQERLRDAFRRHPELEGQVFEALQSITPEELASEGRVYGGGLHKVEPKELAAISARPVLNAIKAHVHIEQQRSLFV